MLGAFNVKKLPKVLITSESQALIEKIEDAARAF